jgi:aspartate/glutamate racemase
MRIALIHALRHSIDPINLAFAQMWPEATLANLLDDSLSAELAKGAPLEAMTKRFLTLARYARDTGADGILFTCSAFGPCIEACAAELAGMPVLKPNEAMIEDAAAYARVGVIATFAPTLVTLPPEFGRPVRTALAHGALAALDAGNSGEHDRLAAEAAASLEGCDVIALAQFSLARAADAVARATGLPVLSTPASAVRKLKALLVPELAEAHLP